MTNETQAGVKWHFLLFLHFSAHIASAHLMHEPRSFHLSRLQTSLIRNVQLSCQKERTLCSVLRGCWYKWCDKESHKIEGFETSAVRSRDGSQERRAIVRRNDQIIKLQFESGGVLLMWRFPFIVETKQGYSKTFSLLNSKDCFYGHHFNTDIFLICGVKSLNLPQSLCQIQIKPNT